MCGAEMAAPQGWNVEAVCALLYYLRGGVCICIDLINICICLNYLSNAFGAKIKRRGSMESVK